MMRWLGILGGALAAALGTSPLTAQATAPNVILIMTDDQGYGDLSCHGNPVVRTRHLDALHSQSVRLVDFHVAPMCTPTRGQLLTGRDAARNGAVNVSSGRTLLRRELPTLADLFAQAGYATAIFGKWHLGDNYPYRPQDRGFQEALWFPSSHVNSLPDAWNNDYFDDVYRRGSRRERVRGYCTDVFFREAISWIRQQQQAKKPFFVYLPTNAPHGPLWVPDSYRQAVAQRLAQLEAEGKVAFSLTPPQRRNLISFLAMIENIDDNMGRLDAFLQASGLSEETIVVFLTDNGSTMGHLYYNAGMRGTKTQLWEGGHRVPCFIRYPKGGFGPARDVPGLTQVQDLFATLPRLCGIGNLPENDGLDLTPVLRGQAAIPDDRMLVINYSRMPWTANYPMPDSPTILQREGSAVLWKRWRLLEDRELYNLDADPLQQRNVIDQHPEVVARMRAYLDRWWAEVKDRANQPQPVVIGHEAENPTMLTACEWLDVFVDQQAQVRRGDRRHGWWEVEVARAGVYELELRRWPREADWPLADGMPATPVTDGVLPAGVALPIRQARLQIGRDALPPLKLEATAKKAVFRATLPAGRTRLYTWLDDEAGQPLLGAYYVYVHNLGPATDRPADAPSPPQKSR